MLVKSFRSFPVMFIVDVAEADLLLSALIQYQGCYGGRTNEFREKLKSETRPEMIRALENDIKQEKESVIKASQMADEIRKALMEDYHSGGWKDDQEDL